MRSTALSGCSPNSWAMAVTQPATPSVRTVAAMEARTWAAAG